MYKTTAIALAAIGRANFALGEQWLEISAWAFGRAHGMNLAAFEAFCGRPLFAAHAAMASGTRAALRNVPHGGVVQQWARAEETFNLLATGLPCLVAEYAGDMDAALGASRSGDNASTRARRPGEGIS